MILIGYAILVTLTLLFIFKHKNKFILNEKSLHKQWLFWLVIIAPLVSGIYFGAGIWSEFSLRLDFKGFSNFFDISKFPFGILALSPILGAFVVSAHRSLQSEKQINNIKKQIEITETKNNIDLFFNTRKSIFERFIYISSNYKEKIERPMSLYSKFLVEKNNYIYINEKMVNSLSSKLDKHFFKYDIIQSFYMCSDEVYENPNFEKINKISLEEEDFISIKIYELDLNEDDYNLCMKLHGNVEIINNLNLFRNEILKSLYITIENKNIFFDIYNRYQTNLINKKDEVNNILTEEEFDDLYATGEYVESFQDGFRSDYIGMIVTDIYFDFIIELIEEINNTIWLIIEVFEVISLKNNALKTLPILQKYIDYCSDTLNELDNFGANITRD
ncbi:hypothetical protein OSB94_16240 [Proteus vulgaris]|uniref:hypothetical protein n=1 Tax=Proteus vulgaris TaxID=585 RepID=UPI0028772086|nr:hypothetical protein [Proteus vulgaris]MDS0789648.1 hypothetical protein [Proteus vulgaris]